APRRRAIDNTVVQFGDVASGAAGKVGIDPPGQDAVDLDVVRGPGGGEAARELNHRALGRGVDRGDAEPEDAGHRADGDDLAAAALLHVRVDRLATVEDAGQVQVDDLVPLA